MVAFPNTKLAALSVLGLISSASAGIQLNAYTDGGCSNYAGQFNQPSNGVLTNWAVSGSNSANIANCDGYTWCDCYWWTGPNASGNMGYTAYGSNNCASAWGSGWKSVSCTYGYNGRRGKRVTAGTYEANL
ncbi:hypothetical protein THAR02_09403 [Trichoderma harzianum]|uniref:Uncharacterized protein n=1 Tax=Trichoderma harzianum TaxID=5544 RepID=A0A0F9ZDP2_TRIHA|nr:hypothetical protein THAR02_09403 [Trichoderma harzianum]